MVKPSPTGPPYPPSSSFPSSTSGSAPPVEPTWKGFIHTSYDALVIIEACLQGKLNHVARRPHDRERASLILSGNVFVYEENASGIKRWTDGMTWSPSRIMGNFLVYRELDKPWPQGQKKVAQKRKRSADQSNDTPTAEVSLYADQTCEDDRRLVGSLVDSYGFKPNGLVKRTLTISYNGIAHHIICYYKVSDIKDGLFHRPGFDQNLKDLKPRLELLNNTTLKFPINDPDEIEPYPSQCSQVASVAQPVFPPNYAMHKPHAHQQPQASTMSVEPFYEVAHLAATPNFYHSLQPNTQVVMAAYQPLPTAHNAIHGMTTSYSHPTLALQTTDLVSSYKPEYSSSLHDSAVASPDVSTASLGIAPPEPLRPVKRVRTTTNMHPATREPSVTVAPIHEHNQDLLVLPGCWAYEDYPGVINSPSKPLSTANGFYFIPTVMDNAQYFPSHTQAQPYSL